ncbi:MAG: hypothetical protein HY331_01205 [Chloroflexi bacterium]|nr:hypothetical protein [Chloroflexota bacterium]
MPNRGNRQAERDDTSGTYWINAIYMVLFTLGFLYMFWELAQRWPVS